MNLVRATGTIGGLTLISRILGFARDVLFARFVGAGLASDCFLIAFRLPNLFRALFAEGAFSAAFVPMFSRTLGPGRGDGTGGDLDAGRIFAEQVLSVLLPVLAAFTILMVALAGPVVWAMTGGFPTHRRKNTALRSSSPGSPSPTCCLSASSRCSAAFSIRSGASGSTPPRRSCSTSR